MPILSNARHERFAQELAKGKSASEAYVLAGYSKNDGNAVRLKGNECVLRRIEELVGKAAKKAEVTIERIIAEFAKIGFADITQAVEWGEAIPVNPTDGEGEREPYFIQGVRIKASAELPSEVSAAISEVRKTKEGIAIKFHDKNAALEKLARHLGMFKEKLELSGNMTLEQLVLASMEEEEELPDDRPPSRTTSLRHLA